MDSSFFRSKRPWSRYKDFLLQSYIDPYIPKVASQKRPIVIVDCFAGRGRFDDGEPGSPVIIADAIKKWREKQIDVRGMFIEADCGNFASLEQVLVPYGSCCTPLRGSFDTRLEELAQVAERNTLFLYVDPYSVRGLLFEPMNRVYRQITRSRSSVEILLNLNVAIFMRWALAALQRHAEIPVESDGLEFQADDPEASVERKTLSEIAGGDYWIPIASDDGLDFSGKLAAFLEMYVERMLAAFPYVCTYWVKAKYHHQVPKYVLIFATRSSHGVRLMNDFMCQARRDFVAGQFTDHRLFDCTPADELVDQGKLREDILAVMRTAGRPMQRPDIRVQLMLRGFFGRLKQGEINKVIGEQLKEGSMISSTGKIRISDEVLLSVRS